MNSISVIIPVAVATGLLTAISETVRWWLNRGGAKVDSAKVVQGMALDLIRPLHEELKQANAEVADLRRDLRALSADMENVISWALVARSLLDRNDLTYPTVPAVITKRRPHEV